MACAGAWEGLAHAGRCWAQQRTHTWLADLGSTCASILPLASAIHPQHPYKITKSRPLSAGGRDLLWRARHQRPALVLPAHTPGGVYSSAGNGGCAACRSTFASLELHIQTADSWLALAQGRVVPCEFIATINSNASVVSRFPCMFPSQPLAQGRVVPCEFRGTISLHSIHSTSQIASVLLNTCVQGRVVPCEFIGHQLPALQRH